MNKKTKKIFLISILSSFLIFSCGDPNETMNKTMADYSEKCLKDEYDCDCWAKKVKAYFKTDEAYIQYYKENDAMPDDLIEQLGECSKDPDFDF